MKIIAPYQITGEILSLINQSKEFLVLVSPYVNFQNWDTIKSEIANAKKRNVKIAFYTRLDNDNHRSWEEIETIGIQPRLVKNLHAKLYFNEKSGIVTSMNLLASSSQKAIEFASLVDTQDELEELKSFVKRFLEPNVEVEKPDDQTLYLSKEKFTTILMNFLANTLSTNVRCKWDRTSYILYANNTFYFNLEKVRGNFWISGIVSGWELENFATLKSNSHLINKVNFYTTGNTITATLTQQLSSSNLDQLQVFEKKLVLDVICGFVLELLAFKDYCYQNRHLQPPT